MRFSILGSGSSGNSALLVTENARVLIDAGFSARKLEALLAGVLKRMREEASSGMADFFQASGDALRLSPDLACSPTGQPE